MAVDIRGAKRNGTEGPAQTTPEKREEHIMDIDENGNAFDVPMDFGGDALVAEYMTFLNENNVSKDDVLSVFNSLMETGTVTWSFDLFDRIPVIFSIRPSWIDDYILEIIDTETANDEKISVTRFNNMVATCNLAASIIRYNNEMYKLETKEDIDKARERVRKMAYVIQNALVKKLAVFDRVIAVATSDWAVQNFTKPRKEKSGQK